MTLHRCCRSIAGPVDHEKRWRGGSSFRSAHDRAFATRRRATPSVCPRAAPDMPFRCGRDATCRSDSAALRRGLAALSRDQMRRDKTACGDQQTVALVEREQRRWCAPASTIHDPRDVSQVCGAQRHHVWSANVAPGSTRRNTRVAARSNSLSGRLVQHSRQKADTLTIFDPGAVANKNAPAEILPAKDA